MKKALMIILMLMWSVSAWAGQRAVTDTGEEVILNDDGTWAYATAQKAADGKIATNPKQFIKPPEATFMLKSAKNDSVFWLDPAKWSFKKDTPDSAAEYALQLKGKDLYGMIITEEIELPLESLAQIALENAREAAADAQMVKQEYRVVNGRKLLYMEIKGTMQGIKFTYLGYYFSDASGSTQFVAYTGTNLVPKYKSAVNDLLNGYDIR